MPAPSLPPPMPEDRGWSQGRGTDVVTRSQSLDRAQDGQRAQAAARSPEDIQEADLDNRGFTLPDHIYEQLTGTGTFASLKKRQQRLSPACLAQANAAALRTWRAMPKSGQATRNLIINSSAGSWKR